LSEKQDINYIADHSLGRDRIVTFFDFTKNLNFLFPLISNSDIDVGTNCVLRIGAWGGVAPDRLMSCQVQGQDL
jgi:hypothetical protein